MSRIGLVGIFKALSLLLDRGDLDGARELISTVLNEARRKR